MLNLGDTVEKRGIWKFSHDIRILLTHQGRGISFVSSYSTKPNVFALLFQPSFELMVIMMVILSLLPLIAGGIAYFFLFCAVLFNIYGVIIL